MDIGTKIIIWPPIFMVRSCTVFPLGVWTDINFGPSTARIGAAK